MNPISIIDRYDLALPRTYKISDLVALVDKTADQAPQNFQPLFQALHELVNAGQFVLAKERMAHIDEAYDKTDTKVRRGRYTHEYCLLFCTIYNLCDSAEDHTLELQYA